MSPITHQSVGKTDEIGGIALRRWLITLSRNESRPECHWVARASVEFGAERTPNEVSRQFSRLDVVNAQPTGDSCDLRLRVRHLVLSAGPRWRKLWAHRICVVSAVCDYPVELFRCCQQHWSDRDHQ